MAIQLGMKRDWLGQEIPQCHKQVNEGSLDFPEMKITNKAFDTMRDYIIEALDQHKVSDDPKKEFMVVFDSFKSKVIDGS